MPAESSCQPGFSNPNKPGNARSNELDKAIEAIRVDAVFATFVIFLAKMTLKRRHAAIGSLDFWWNHLLPPDRAKIVGAYRSTATMAEVARWSGVSKRTLHRWPEYKSSRKAARRDWPKGYKDRNGRFDGWKGDG